MRGGLPGGITSSVDTSVPGQITLNLTGTTSLANYQTAIQQVRYSNNSENPTAGDRILQVTVNDGLLNSAVATTTVNVTATNDAPVGNTDTVITNVAAEYPSRSLSQLLLANDTDPRDRRYHHGSERFDWPQRRRPRGRRDHRLR